MRLILMRAWSDTDPFTDDLVRPGNDDQFEWWLHDQHPSAGVPDSTVDIDEETP